ncbi:MAG: guanylate kinase [candidate division KSB1 bacterium]
MHALQPETDTKQSVTPGFMVVLSAPSGGGKTSILKQLMANGEPAFRYSVSATTRAPRNNEEHGRDYFFLSVAEFEQKAARGEFIEHALVHGNYYGTPRELVQDWIAAGKIVLTDLDVQGGLNVKQQIGARALLIFIKPPSLDSLRERLARRNTDKPEEIDLRLHGAAQEMEMADRYDYVLENRDLEHTVQEVLRIINQHRTLSQ